MDTNSKYKVHITEYALGQMEEIKQYIAYELMAPQSAKNLLLEMRKAVASLGYMPARNPLVDEEKWREQGIRRIIVKNFLLYYWIDQANAVVYVTAIVYEKRDQLKQLNKMAKEKS